MRRPIWSRPTGSAQIPPQSESVHTRVKLDCHSCESTLHSLGQLYGTEPAEIQAFLASIDLEGYYSENDPALGPDDLIASLLERHLGHPRNALSSVVWFHLTRVLPHADFGAGILPLDQVLDGVWATLSTIFNGSARADNLSTLRREGVRNFQYELKVSGGRHLYGPYAMLVREAAFRSREMGNHDYLGVPEIVRDICDGYRDRFGDDIEDDVRAALRPCIVRFVSGRRVGWDCVSAAVHYLYVTVHDLKMSLWSNTCYDGGGLAVHRSAIEGVDFIERV